MTMLLPNMVLIMQPMFAQLKDRLKDRLPVTKTVQPILRIILIQQRLQQNQVTVQQHKQQLTQAVQKEQLVQGIPIFQHGILQKYTRQLENQLFTMDNCSNNLTIVQVTHLMLMPNGLLGYIYASTYLSCLISS